MDRNRAHNNDRSAIIFVSKLGMRKPGIDGSRIFFTMTISILISPAVSLCLNIRLLNISQNISRWAHCSLVSNIRQFQREGSIFGNG